MTTPKAQELREKLLSLRQKRQVIRRLRKEVESTPLEPNHRDLLVAIDDFEAVHSQRRHTQRLVEISSTWNVLNDSFCIWYSGPFGTINGLRLGAEGPVSTPQTSASVSQSHTYANLSEGKSTVTETIKIQWTEINSALGQLALLLKLIEEQPGIAYRHEIVPMGSTSRIGLRLNGKAPSYYNLYYADWSLLGAKNNLNTALQGLSACVFDAMRIIRQRDPTLVWPHALERNQAEEYTIGDLSVTYGNDGAEWTRAMKYLLTNVKQLLNYKAFGLFDQIQPEQRSNR